MQAKITRVEGGLNVFIPFEDVHSLRVALHPCPCKMPKSFSTEDIRQRFERALAKALYAQPKSLKGGM